MAVFYLLDIRITGGPILDSEFGILIELDNYWTHFNADNAMR